MQDCLLLVVSDFLRGKRQRVEEIVPALMGWHVRWPLDAHVCVCACVCVACELQQVFPERSQILGRFKIMTKSEDSHKTEKKKWV